VEFVRSLRRLWRHRYFRRLLAVRVATQSCDGLLQIALASYVLFSPERQPDAASIATVLAITLLPFSVLGPFVGVVLDRVPVAIGVNRVSDDPESLALGGGEDYELLFAAPDPARIEDVFAGRGLGTPLRIGRCTDDPAERRLRDGDLPVMGWVHG